MNQFQFTRTNNQQEFYDNKKFLDKFNWLISPMHDKLFEDIENFLLWDKKFIERKRKMFEKEVKQLMSMKLLKNYSMKKLIQKIYRENMYKYEGYNDLLKFLKRKVSPLIEEKYSSMNITKSEMIAIYNGPKNLNLKWQIEAMILSYFYLFISKFDTIDAGDLATAGFTTGLTLPNFYNETHPLFTKIYNDMTNGSIPGSIFDLPKFFVYQDKIQRKFIQVIKDFNNDHGRTIQVIKKIIRQPNIPDMSLTYYHYL